jgi:hypothetical protein
MKASSRVLLLAMCLCGLAFGCSAAKKDDAASDGSGNQAPGSMSSNNGGAGQSANSGSSGSMATSNGSGGSSSPGSSGKGGDTSSPAGGTAGKPATEPPPEQVEMLDANVDWKALKLVYAPMYSAFDGEHTFQVPVHVDGASVELSGWKAIPSDAVSFEPDPDGGGVLVTILKGVPEITIAASDGDIGGSALLSVTVGTPDDWKRGEARYNNHVDFEFPDIDFSKALDPSWMPPPPPPDLACNNCHSLGAKYFEIQHTPTQAARFSDADLKTIFTTGMKPEGVGFRVLPEMLGDMTAQEVYSGFHKWEATDEEQKGLIIYLRSLTPTGQGDILLPDGTYVAPGTVPDGGLGSGN